MTERAPVTYREAGVDIDAGEELVERIKPRVKRSMRREVLGGIGGFGALVEIPLDRYRKPVLVSGTDGVGTKLRLAIDERAPRHRRHRSGGHVRQRRRRAGRGTAIFPRLLCHRRARCRRRRARHRGHRRGLRAGRLRAGRRRDRGNARDVSRPGLRPRRLLRRRGRKGSHHRRIADRRGRRGAGPALLRAALQRILADPQDPRGERRRSSIRPSRACR